MKDNERISNLEELMAEVLMRLDRLEDGQKGLRFGQKTLEESMLELAKNQINLNDRQASLQEGMISLTQVVRQNTIDIRIIKDTMCTKDDFSRLFEFMMTRFDASDKRFDSIDKRFDAMDNRMDGMQGDITELKDR